MSKDKKESNKKTVCDTPSGYKLSGNKVSGTHNPVKTKGK